MFGDARDKKLKSGRRYSRRYISSLTKDHPIFKDECPGRNLVITSYHTLSSRNGPAAQRNWQTSKRKPVQLDRPDPEWPKCLEGKFGCVVYDEVHTIRNMGTSMYKTVSWLKGQFNLLLTATPAFNSIEDIKAMLSLMIHPANEAWWDDTDLDQSYNPLLDKAASDPN